jgi:membrane-associated protease RseP (regulator of RpoE activity)
MSSSLGLNTPATTDSAVTAAVARKPQKQRLWLHVLLFFLALFTTTMIGMRYMSNFHQGRPPIVDETDVFPYQWVAGHLSELAEGLPFSLCLLSILLAHEFGHYYNCLRHGLKTSLPYLLPAPTLSGTAGAVIRMGSRIKTRQALLDIGLSGPLWGFVVAMPWLVAGILLSKPIPATAPLPMVWLQNPLIVHILLNVMRIWRPDLPQMDQMLFHPILVATWIGLLITSLNLIPAGQLDGGHILYSISPRWHKAATNIVIFLLIVAGTGYWLPWLAWAIILMLPAMKHPSVPMLPAPNQTAGLKYITWAVLFLLTFHYMPFIGYHGDKSFLFSLKNIPQILSY